MLYASVHRPKDASTASTSPVKICGIKNEEDLTHPNNNKSGLIANEVQYDVVSFNGKTDGNETEK